MGTGRYKDGKFDLILSIRHDADDTRILQWERSFRRASEILFDATEGQMQFGKLFVGKNSVGSQEADMWLMNEEGTSSTQVVYSLGDSGVHITLKSDEKNKPFVIIHEFGHYALGLFDEYKGPTGVSAECTGSTEQGACIMEHGYWDGDQISDDGVLTEGPINEFCTADNHDPDEDTIQESEHGESCWETIGGYYPDIEVPASVPDDSPEPTGHEDVEWILLVEDPRFALVLDKSGSMSAQNAIAGVRYGADYWVNSLAQTDDSLSIVSYNQAQTVILPLTTVSTVADLSGITDAIADISPGGTTNIGGAMSEGANQITSPGDRAATQVMILFSDGLHNTGTSPETVVSNLVEEGIRVYTIGFGPYVDQDRLRQIAEDTGGGFEQIDADPTTPDAQLEIQNYLIQISGEVRDGTGIITMSPGLLPEPTASEFEEATRIAKLRFTPKDIELITKRPLAYKSRSTGYDHKAYVEQGSSKATFVVSYQDGKSVNFHILRPNGVIVNPETDADAVFVNPTNAPYAFYIINNPERGYWVMRVTRGQTTGEIPFKVFAFSENKEISIGVKGIRPLYRVGDTVSLQSQVYCRVPLTDIVDPIARIMPKVKKTRSLTKLVKTTLRQRLLSYDPSGTPSKIQTTLDNGVYRGEFTFDEPGSYTVSIRFVNSGKAREASSISERRREGDKEDKIEPAPPFVRTKRFQVHVGPLPTGKDVETSALKNKFMYLAIALLFAVIVLLSGWVLYDTWFWLEAEVAFLIGLILAKLASHQNER